MKVANLIIKNSKKILIIFATIFLISCSIFNYSIMKLGHISFKLPDNCQKTKNTSNREYTEYLITKGNNTVFTIIEYKENLSFVCLDTLNDLQNKNIKYATYTDGYLTKIYYDDQYPKCLLFVRKDQYSEPENAYIFTADCSSETQLIELINTIEYIE